MRFTPMIFSGLFVAVAFALQSSASGQLSHEGKLFVHGGGGVNGTIASFVAAAGDEIRLVVIPTATSDDNLPTNKELESQWKTRGIENVHQLHTRDRTVADSDSFIEPIQKATAVFINGGDQQRLSDAYAGTKTETALRDLLQRGGVIGGTSAGAAIMSKVMIARGRTEPRLSTGFDLVPGAIVDQHFLNRSRLNRLMNAVRRSEGRVGIGIDERTCLVVSGDSATVKGEGYVTTVRLLDGELSIETYLEGDKIDLANHDVGPKADATVPELDVPGIKELANRGRPLSKFVPESISAAMKLRASFLKKEESESRASAIQKLSLRFARQYSDMKESGLPTLFDFSAIDFEAAIHGIQSCPTATETFGPFIGKWFGLWKKQKVDHHWSRVIEPDHYSFATGFPEFDIGWQYAWIGDGYGINHCVRFEEQGTAKRFILGYTEHLQDGDFEKIVARRPHVGIHIGPGKLIWITAREVFFEEAHASETGEIDSYSIIGFRYTEESPGNFNFQNGFVTTYSTDKNRRTPFGKIQLQSGRAEND